MAKWYERVGRDLSKIGKGAKVAASEVSKGAKVAASEVSRGAKIAASEVRKTVGVGVGEVKLELPKLSFEAGESIVGKLELVLAEPTEAKRLCIRLTGSRDKISYASSKAGGKTPERHTEKIHEFEIELEGARGYESETFEFSIDIPLDAKPVAPEIRTEGLLGDVVRVAASIAGSDRTNVAWSLLAYLDIPWKRNVSTSVDIMVRPQSKG